MVTPVDRWLLLVTNGDSPRTKKHQSLGINKYPQIPTFPKVGPSAQKTAKKRAKVGGRNHFNNKKAPKVGASERGRTRTCNQWLKRVLVITGCLRPRACLSTRVLWTTGQTSLLELIFKVSNHFLLTKFRVIPPLFDRIYILKACWLLRAVPSQEPALPPESFGQQAKPVSWN